MSRSNLVASSLHAEAWSRTACAILIVSNPYRHGIDFKNPFTMSKRAVAAQSPHVRTWGSRVFISRKRQSVVEPIGIEPMT